MDIWVVSRGRWDRQRTLTCLMGIPNVRLGVHETEYRRYLYCERKYGCKVIPLDYEGIAEKRKIIGEASRDKFVMFDDDLYTFERVSTTDWHLKRTKGDGVERMLRWIEETLDEYVHVSVSARQQNQRKHYPIHINMRCMQVLAYRAKYHRKVEHCRTEFMEDFDVQLQLIRMGLPSCSTTHWAVNQETNTRGGCSTQRSLERQKIAAEKLRSLHPGYVTVVEKQYEGEFGKRSDVRVAWARAYSDACKELPTEVPCRQG